MMRSQITIVSIIFGAILVSCAPAVDANIDDQIATSVAATVLAQGVAGQSETTAAPLDGEVPQSNFGNCANTGQLNIAYVSNGSVWLWVDGGTKTQLTDSGDIWAVRISDDGCLIAYSRMVPNPIYTPDTEDFPLPSTINELWVVASDGTNNHKLAGLEFFGTLPITEVGPGYSLYQFDWQPGTHALAFDTEIIHQGVGLATADDLHLVSADNGLITTLLAYDQGGDFTFSPNGQRVAFSTGNSVGVVNADGSELRSNLIAFPFILTYSEYQYRPPIHWDPNSIGFMVAIPPEDGLALPINGVYPETSLWYVPLDGSPAFETGSVQSVWLAQQEVQFAPDNSRIAYLRPLGEQGENQRELVIALSNGSPELAQIRLPGVDIEAWSPESNQFIYSFRDPEFQLVLGDLQNPSVQTVSTLTGFPAEIADVLWVDNSTIVLQMNGQNGTELSVMNLDGTGVLVETFVDFYAQIDIAH